MNNDLSIRAAKALKLKKKNQLYFIEGYGWMTPDLFEFTSSYDWAFLGVAKLRAAGYIVALQIDVTGIRILISFKQKMLIDNFYMGDDHEKEITRAWVEVLESQ